MIDFILNIICSPEFIILGTFFRTGPITGENSGKIKFANIVTNGIIQEDTNGITISTFFNQAVDLNEIAFGTGGNLGLTSSKFFRFDTITSSITPRLIGPGIINSFSPAWNLNYNLNFGIYDHSFIVNGQCNNIADFTKGNTPSCADLIIGGYCVSVGGYPSVTGSFHNVIIDGYKNCLYGGRGNVIIGAGSTIQTKYNTIISSSNDVQIDKPSSYNSVISTCGNKVIQSDSRFSTILSSYNSDIGYSPPFTSYGKFNFNSILSSEQSQIKSDDPDDVNINLNTIIASRCSVIFGGCSLNTYTPGPSSCSNSIISTCESCIFDAKGSAILGGQKTKIINYFNDSPSFGRNLLSSSVIGGYSNLIDNYFLSTVKKVETRLSTVIGGRYNCIRMNGCSQNSVIIGGECNYGFGYYAVIISGFKNCSLAPGIIISSKYSNISGSGYNSIISSCSSLGSGSKESIDISSISIGSSTGYCSIRISNYNGFFYNNTEYSNTIIASKGSLQPTIPLPIGGGSSRLFISYKRSSFDPSNYSSCYSSIIGSCDSYMEGTKTSIVLLSKCSCMYESRSSIMSGTFNKIFGSNYSSIISSSQSYIINSNNSSIIGGSNNILGTNSTTTCNSVILGGSGMTLTFSNTVMTKHFNFACASIFTNATQYCNTRVGTFSNCFYCSLKVINGFIVS